MRLKAYKIQYTYSSRNDMLDMKKYILQTFKYRELGKNFTAKMKKVADVLRFLPTGYDKTGFQYRDYDVYLKPYQTYLIFFTVDEVNHVVTILRILQDGMNWQFIMRRWLKQEEQ